MPTDTLHSGRRPSGARTPEASADPPPPRGALAPGRLRQIAARLSSGFYDSEAVRQRIAARLLPDLDDWSPAR